MAKLKGTFSLGVGTHFFPEERISSSATFDATYTEVTLINFDAEEDKINVGDWVYSETLNEIRQIKAWLGSKIELVEPFSTSVTGDDFIWINGFNRPYISCSISGTFNLNGVVYNGVSANFSDEKGLFPIIVKVTSGTVNIILQ